MADGTKVRVVPLPTAKELLDQRDQELQHTVEAFGGAARIQAELARRQHVAELQERVRDAGVDPASELGQRLLRKLDRTGGYLCLAHTRRGTLCLALGDGAGWRCRIHGGASSGPKTEDGRRRALANLRQYQDRAQAIAEPQAPETD